MGAEDVSADFLSKQADDVAAPVVRRARMRAPELAIVVTVAVTLAAALLAISSRPQKEDGQRTWRSGSLLRPLTQLLSLNHEYPTARGVEVKWLVQGLGVAAVLMIGVAGWYASAKPRDPEARPAGVRPPRSLRDRLRLFFVSASPATAAQIALVLYAGWALLSALWAPWPAGAFGEAMRQLLPIVWAIVLGRTLSARAARSAAMSLVGALTAAAIIGVWYFYERNPGQRLKFPIGNPIYLAACLLPGLLLPAAWIVSWAAGLVRPRTAPEAAPTVETQRYTETSAAETAVGAPLPMWLVVAAVIAAVVGLGVMGWAFKLAGSRGPAVGLGGGLLTVVYLVVPGLVRWVSVELFGAAPNSWSIVVVSKVARWGIIAATAAGLAASVFWVRRHLEDEGSRWATARFRTYTWRYAIDRMAVRPVTGTGQGGYLLGAHAMSLGDAENDPAAFPGGLLGHAHSEWLEVLSDLGAAGFALIATALGITLWGAGLALKKLPGRRDRWTLLGLAGALGAMVVEEMTDSTMRTEVFPLVFYTVVGLIWAMAAATERPRPEATDPGHPARVRAVGLILGIVGTGAIAWLSISDWQGARAEYQAGEYAERKDWDGAMAAAASAQRMRLGIEGRLRALDCAGLVAQQAAEYWFDELRGVVLRGQQEGRFLPSALQVARENGAKLEYYFDAAKQADLRLLHLMPYYMNTAGRLGGLYLMKGDAEEIEAALGLRATVSDYTAEARRWLAHEYERDPFNAEFGMRLLVVVPPSEPMAERLKLLRTPLRAGPVRPAVTAVLRGLMPEHEFEAVMTEWMTAARAALHEPDRPWADRYAPETLRLAALRCEVQRAAIRGGATGAEAIEQATRAMSLAQDADQLSGGAATLLLEVRARFPAAAACARADQAKYRLWASPYQPEEALALQQQALAEWSAVGPRDRYEVLQADLSTYLLAAGREEEARAHLRKLFPEDTGETLDLRVAAHLQILGEWFINAPPLARPARFEALVTRLVQLDPVAPAARLVAAQLALERQNDAAAMEHLEALRKRSSVAQYVNTVRFLVDRFPGSEALQLLVRRLSSPQTGQTRPGE